MQRVREGKLVQRRKRCWGRHFWQVHQHNVAANENNCDVFVLAWKQCAVCAKSKLIHILE
jgi:hypothetical protein